MIIKTKEEKDKLYTNLFDILQEMFLEHPFGEHKWEMLVIKNWYHIRIELVKGIPDYYYHLVTDPAFEKIRIEIVYRGANQDNDFIQLLERDEFKIGFKLYTKDMYEKYWVKLGEPRYTYYKNYIAEKDLAKDFFLKLKSTYEKYNVIFKEFIENKNTSPTIDKYQQIIDEYIAYCKSDEIWDEGYKLQAISHFQKHWNINADDFGKMFKEAVRKRVNLIHKLPIATLVDGAKIFPDVLKGIFKDIFDDTIELNRRYHIFKDETTKLSKKLQDYYKLDKPPTTAREAEFAFLLTCNNPQKYYFYNSRFYVKFAKWVGKEPKKAGEKYVHYKELMDYFNKNYVINNIEVAELTEKNLFVNEKLLESRTVLTQSIIYIFFEHIRRDIDEKALFDTIKVMELENASNFYNLIDLLTENLSLDIDDQRIHYYCSANENINITIGQRYCLIYRFKKSKPFGFILPKETETHPDIKRSEFDGMPLASYCKTDNCNEILKLSYDLLEASKKELHRAVKSGYKRYSNSFFEKSIYDLKYRNEVFDNIFGEHPLNNCHDNNFQTTKNPEMHLNQILYGPPGTGKTYHTINKAIEIADKDFYDKHINNREKLKKRYEELVESGQIVFTTFHQSLSYEDFIEGIKPLTENGGVVYDVISGIFKTLCSKALSKTNVNFIDSYNQFTKELIEAEEESFQLNTKTGKPYWVSVNSNGNLSVYTSDNKNYQGVMTKEKLERQANGEYSFEGWTGYANGVIRKLKSDFKLSDNKNDNTNKNFVLIIDEINRGNIASIFGELITLIETDKRKGAKEELSVTLPYSKTEFSVPQNLSIIGTMNTADRSVEALDTALRRRFVFEEMPPNSNLLDANFHGVNLQEVLSAMNKRIELLLDKDHKIGHSYFMNLKSIKDLRFAFKNKIVPLLEEYFYGDFAKIGLVLGESFIKINKNEGDIFKRIGNDTETDYLDFEDKIIYKTVVPEDKFEEAVKEIYA